MKRIAYLTLLALALTACTKDEDGDGYTDDVDCDDMDAEIHPDADEICDDIDNNCDGVVDEDAIDQMTYYADADADGYGNADDSMDACAMPSGYVEDATDCDDDADTTYPGADEICDGADNDCDTDVDEDATDASTWYADTDGDGYGDMDSTMDACDQPDDYVDNGDDCYDGSADITMCDTIYEIQDGTVAEDTAVITAGNIVTGVTTYGFFLQDPMGGEYSAIYVYTGSGIAEDYAVGDSVIVTGTYIEYSGLSEISVDRDLDTVALISSGNDVPAAEVVDTATLAGEESGEPWESVLVMVENVTVADPDLGYGEWEIDDGLRVDDSIYDANDDYTIEEGTSFTSITGPLYYSYGDFKLLPRSAADLTQ